MRTYYPIRPCPTRPVGKCVILLAPLAALTLLLNPTLLILHQRDNKDLTEDTRDMFGDVVHPRNAMETRFIQDACSVDGLHDKLMAGWNAPHLIHCKRVMYNRVPKCASRTTKEVFNRLSSIQNFTFHDTPKPGIHNYFTETKDLKEFAVRLSKLQEPFVLAQHVHYVNFSSYGLPSPVYINVIRDPVDRAASEYYYNLYGSGSGPHWQQIASNHTMSFDVCVKVKRGYCMGVHRILPFFCGHELWCKQRNERVLQQAKSTVARHYLLVGLQDELKAFMELLEKLMPHFFKGAPSIFTEIEKEVYKESRTSYNWSIKANTRAAMRRHLQHEYDFYYFVQQRFHDLYEKMIAGPRISGTSP